MRPRALFAAFAFSLLSIGAFAQDGLRSASLPERSLPSLPSERPDLFRATPDTFVPHPDQRPQVGPGFVIGGFWPYGPWPWPDGRHSRRDGRYRNYRRYGDFTAPPAQPERPPAAAPVAPPDKYVPGVPGKPKTFYVIPDCYAGDKPPQADRLRPGCDASKVRKIPPPPV
jgi:hypothetical protein